MLAGDLDATLRCKASLRTVSRALQITPGDPDRQYVMPNKKASLLNTYTRAPSSCRGGSEPPGTTINGKARAHSHETM